MPRTAGKPYTKVLEYFKTADLAEAQVIADQAKGILKDRIEASVPTVPRKKPRRKPKDATVAATSGEPKARKKPGPKPKASFVTPDENAESTK